MSTTFREVLDRFIDTDSIKIEDIPCSVMQDALDEFEKYYTFGELFYLAVEHNGQLYISPVFCTLAHSDRESAYLYEIAAEHGEYTGYDGYSGLSGSLDFFYPFNSDFVKQSEDLEGLSMLDENFILRAYHVVDYPLKFINLDNPSVELVFDEWKRGLPVAKLSNAHENVCYPDYDESYPYKACFIHVYDSNYEGMTFGYTVIKAGTELFNRLASHVKKGGY